MRKTGGFLLRVERLHRAAVGSESLRLLPAAKPTSLYKGGLGWLANAGGEALPRGGGNGRLQGPLVKGAGFRDCASKRGRLGDSCCGWRDFTVQRWETESLRVLPAAKPTSLYKGGLGWLANAGDEALPCGGGKRQAPRPPCKGGWLPRLRKHTRKTGGFLLRVERFCRAAVGNGIPPAFACGKTHLPLQGRLWVVSQRRWQGFAVLRLIRQAPRPPCKGGWLPRLRKQTRKTGGFLLRVERPYRAAVGSESLRLLPAAKPTSLYKGGLGGYPTQVEKCYRAAADGYNRLPMGAGQFMNRRFSSSAF